MSYATITNSLTGIHQIASYVNDAKSNVSDANYYDYQLVFNATA